MENCTSQVFYDFRSNYISCYMDRDQDIDCLVDERLEIGALN